MNKYVKPIIFLVLMIIICSAIGRVLTSGETLSEYADNNPEIAYATPDQAKFTSPLPSDSSLALSSGMLPSALLALTSLKSMNFTPDAGQSVLADAESSDCIYYEDGFFYQSLPDNIVLKITGISYPVAETLAPAFSSHPTNVVPDDEVVAISYRDLCYMNVLYYDFDGIIQTGELICNKGIAQDLVEIFYELYLNEYQIEKIRLIDEYDGDDTASMMDNNTSCFNYRVVDGTDSLSKHALGCAIDINPFYNPYIVFNKNGSGETYISPQGSEIYADRSQNFPYKIDETDLCYKLFKAHGFTWGGDWNSCKDYQHFQKIVQ